MDCQLIWTEQASEDLESIVRYIARRNPEAAVQVGFEIYERVQILLRHPEVGSIIDALREGGWRKLAYRRWIIVYTIRSNKIIIGRVWPTAKGTADLMTPL